VTRVPESNVMLLLRIELMFSFRRTQLLLSSKEATLKVLKENIAELESARDQKLASGRADTGQGFNEDGAAEEANSEYVKY